MARNQIVFVDTEDDVADLEARYTVVETMDLADEGYAVVVRTESDEEVSEINYMAVENYDENIEFELLTSPPTFSSSENAGDWGTIEDVRDVHNVESGKGDGAGVTWVVNDSGIDTHHPLFEEGQIIERHDATDSGGTDNVGHGTAVAGQIVRLAPNVELIDCRIFGSDGKTSLRTILRSLEWLVNNTDKYDGVNMSWGSPERVRKIDTLIERLAEDDVRVIAAAGNSGSEVGSPAVADDAFSVGSCDKKGEVSDYSSYGDDVPDIMVVGEQVRLARAQGTEMGEAIDDNYVVASGTSFSAPAQSGMEAAYISLDPEVNYDEMSDDFVETADDIKDTDKDGAGLTSYRDALDARKEARAEEEAVGATVWAFGGNDSIYVAADVLESGKYRVDPEALADAFEKVE